MSSKYLNMQRLMHCTPPRPASIQGLPTGAPRIERRLKSYDLVRGARSTIRAGTTVPTIDEKKPAHDGGHNPYQWRHGGDEISINPYRILRNYVLAVRENTWLGPFWRQV